MYIITMKFFFVLRIMNELNLMAKMSWFSRSQNEEYTINPTNRLHEENLTFYNEINPKSG